MTMNIGCHAEAEVLTKAIHNTQSNNERLISQ